MFCDLPGMARRALLLASAFALLTGRPAAAAEPARSADNPDELKSVAAWLVIRHEGRSDSLAIAISESMISEITSLRSAGPESASPLPFGQVVMALRAAATPDRSPDGESRLAVPEREEGPWSLRFDGYGSLDGGGGVSTSRGSGSITLDRRRGGLSAQLSASGEHTRTVIDLADEHAVIRSNRLEIGGGIERRVVRPLSIGATLSGSLSSIPGIDRREFLVATGVELMPVASPDRSRGPLSLRVYFLSIGGLWRNGPPGFDRLDVPASPASTRSWTARAAQLASSIEGFPEWGSIRVTARARRFLGSERWLLQGELDMRIPLTANVSLNTSAIYGDLTEISDVSSYQTDSGQYSTRFGLTYAMGGWSDESQLIKAR